MVKKVVLYVVCTYLIQSDLLIQWLLLQIIVLLHNNNSFVVYVGHRLFWTPILYSTLPQPYNKESTLNDPNHISYMKFFMININKCIYDYMMYAMSKMRLMYHFELKSWLLDLLHVLFLVPYLTWT